MAGIDLAGASVLVTGATGALGTRLASRLADAGARLTLTGRDGAALDAVPVVGAARVVADLQDAGAPERVVQAAIDAYGELDGVVQALGVVAFGPLETTTDETLTTLVETNLLAPLRVVRAALPALRASTRTPFVANLSAVVAEQPVAGMTAYSATKAALSGADQALARELRRDRVHVLDLRPPHTETGLAHRPIAGSAPALPTGLDPDVVADRIVRAIREGAREVASEDFGR